MKDIYRDFLFDKKIFVNEGTEEKYKFEVLFSLANMFNIRITKGASLAWEGMLNVASQKIGIKVPEPFYRNFPESVRELSDDRLLFDQLVHYSVTYGFGNFSEPGHSIYEEPFERAAFKEKTAIKDFIILTESEATEKLKDIVGDMFSATRKLNRVQYELLLEFIKDYDILPQNIGSKNLALKLLNDTRNVYFARFIKLSDIPKLTGEIVYLGMEPSLTEHREPDLKKLNLKNRDRKFITAVMDHLFRNNKCNLIECYEKKDIWCGLLHHIHYRPVNEDAEHFVNAMRNKGNGSVYSRFERVMAEEGAVKAAEVLEKGKGSGAVLRRLDHILSRCVSVDEMQAVLSGIDTKNAVILIQLLIKYSFETGIKEKRAFAFSRFENMKIHVENKTEVEKRRSFLGEDKVKFLKAFIEERLKKTLKGRAGKVYIDPVMKNYALPISESTAQSGYGVLSKGSRIHIDPDRKLRAFTYWEKVDDIDLSCFGIFEDGKQREFSWRTMAHSQSTAILFSGDQTSGYKGGSEYFDIDPQKVRDEYPGIKYMVFCDNVYSRIHFDGCYCTAGYMIRETEDSGEVFEPKTVKSSFRINSPSTFAYLFALDMEKSDFIWLNISKNSSETVAGTTALGFLRKYFDVTSVINLGSFFEMMADEIVSEPRRADIVLSDTLTEKEIPPAALLIRSCDHEKISKFLS